MSAPVGSNTQSASMEERLLDHEGRVNSRCERAMRIPLQRGCGPRFDERRTGQAAGEFVPKLTIKARIAVRHVGRASMPLGDRRCAGAVRKDECVSLPRDASPAAKGGKISEHDLAAAYGTGCRKSPARRRRLLRMAEFVAKLQHPEVGAPASAAFGIDIILGIIRERPPRCAGIKSDVRASLFRDRGGRGRAP